MDLRDAAAPGPVAPARTSLASRLPGARRPRRVAVLVVLGLLLAATLGPVAWWALHHKHDDGTWVLRDGPTSVPAGLTITIEGAYVSGDGPCNSFSASWSQDDGITGDEILSTAMGCPDPVSSQEDAYYALLGSVSDVEVDGDTLVLSGPRGTLRYSRVP